MEKLPVYDAVLGEDGGVGAISIVKNPAMEAPFMAFSDKPEKFELAQEKERILLGAAMVPDKLVLRKSNIGEPYFLRFSKETIKEASYRFFKFAWMQAINAEHSEWLDNVYVCGGFIQNSSIGMMPPENLSGYPDGTWFVFVKVDNDDVWRNYVETGKVTGFSIEAMLGVERSGQEHPTEMSAVDLIDDILSKLDTTE